MAPSQQSVRSGIVRVPPKCEIVFDCRCYRQVAWDLMHILGPGNLPTQAAPRIASNAWQERVTTSVSTYCGHVAHFIIWDFRRIPYTNHHIASLQPVPCVFICKLGHVPTLPSLSTYIHYSVPHSQYFKRLQAVEGAYIDGCHVVSIQKPVPTGIIAPAGDVHFYP